MACTRTHTHVRTSYPLNLLQGQVQTLLRSPFYKQGHLLQKHGVVTESVSHDTAVLSAAQTVVTVNWFLHSRVPILDGALT